MGCIEQGEEVKAGVEGGGEDGFRFREEGFLFGGEIGFATGTGSTRGFG
jgi:hypothetical protein